MRREQEEDEAKTQADLDAALALSTKLNKEASLKRKRDDLGPEPPEGADATKLRLQLPNGSKIDRRFLSNDTFQEVHRRSSFPLANAVE